MLLNQRPCLWAALGAAVALAQTPESVDVVIVGGGASGAHAAVRLRDDYKKSVLVVEKSNRLVSDRGSPVSAISEAHNLIPEP